jgi:hypothetical protein
MVEMVAKMGSKTILKMGMRYSAAVAYILYMVCMNLNE